MYGAEFPTIVPDRSLGPTPGTALYYVVLLRSEDSEVLLSSNSPSFTVPIFEVPQRQRVAPNLLAAVRKHLGITAVARFEIPAANSFSDSRGVVLESSGTEMPVSGAQWLEVSKIEWGAICPVTARDALRRALAAAISYNTGQRTGNFVRPGWLSEIREWADATLMSRGERMRESWEQYNMGPDFSLIRFDTLAGNVWFKAVDEMRRREFSITRCLSEMCLPHVASVLATDESCRGWLMSGCGGHPLDENSPRRFWNSAARGLAELQMASLRCSAPLLDAGCMDLRISVLAGAIDPFLSRIEMLMRQQPKDSPPRLAGNDLRLIQQWAEFGCRQLSDLAIPDALGHADLNSGNILVGSGGPVFLDWLQGFVGHPLLAFEFLLRLSERTTRGSPTIAGALCREYLKIWSRCYRTELQRSFDIIPLLAPLAFSISCGGHHEQTADAPLLRSLARCMHREALRLDSGATPAVLTNRQLNPP